MANTTPLDAELIAAIEKMLSNGVSQIDTMRALGFRPETLSRWKARGDDDLEVHPNPKDYTLAQLRALARDQGVDVGVEVSGRVTKKAIAALVYVPTPYTALAQALRRARSAGIAHAIDRMLASGRDDWRMWAHYLAMRDPDNWSKSALERNAETEREADAANAAALLDEGRSVVVAIEHARTRRAR